MSFLALFICQLRSTPVISLVPCETTPKGCCPIGPNDVINSSESDPCCSSCEGTWPFFKCCNKDENSADFICCKPLRVPDSCHFRIFNAFTDGKDLTKCREEFYGRNCDIIIVGVFEQKKCNPGLKKPTKKEEFIRCFVKFVECYYGVENKAAKKVACLVYDELHSHEASMYMFLAHALFNTSGFKFLTNWNDPEQTFKSRGLLQIRESYNYKRLDKINKTHRWVEHPEALATLSDSAIIATIRFWKYLTKCEGTFCDTICALNPEESHPGSLSNETLRKRLENRKRVYKVLCQFFGVKCYMGKC